MKHVVGLTGGIASGKTTVSDMFRRLGAEVVDADVLARKVVQPGSPVLDRIRERFGDEMICRDGTLNRPLLRERMIESPELRQELNAITHPEIIRMEHEEIQASTRDLILVDAPLMIESGSHERFREIIVVYVTRDIQLKRLMKRDNITRDEAASFLSTQMDLEEKKRFATYLIDNSGTLEDTASQVVRLYEVLST